MKFTIFFILLLFCTVMYSQEYVSTKQTIYLFGDNQMDTTNTYYFTVKDGYVQQTNRKRMRVVNVFELGIEMTDEKSVSKMIFVKDSEQPYLEYTTVDLVTQEIARFIYFLHRE